MAIARMTKVMIVSHRDEASQLLENLQAEGICQVLNADEAAVTRDAPELAAAGQKPKDIEQFLTRLTNSIAFLKDYTASAGALAGILAPRTVVDANTYNEAVSDERISQIVEQCERCRTDIGQTRSESDRFIEVLERLEPWRRLETPVEQITQLDSVVCFAGLVSAGQFEKLTEQIGELSAAIQTAGATGNKHACIVAALKSDAAEVQKLLRAAEFEPANFEGFTGTIAEIIRGHKQHLEQAQRRLRQLDKQAAGLSENLLKLQILHDHYENLLDKEQTRASAPATEKTVILEGWVKEKNYSRLEQTVSRFGASTVSRIQPAEDEEIPVEIENRNVIRPFEVITRLYGMPQHFEVDPTIFLAPFFALFFALCLTDAGYGLVIIGLMFFFVKKMQGDKKLMWMLGICSAVTVVAGALTGGWFGDGVQQFLPALKPVREKLMWFDPFEKPMMFFALSLALGYVQIMTGLMIGFVHNLKRKQYIAGLCDQFMLLVMLNSIAIFAASKAAVVPVGIGKFFGILAIIPAVMILLFSQRQGGWGSRIGMGMYNLFSTVFYVGDVLSYMRLMALGMVTAGLAMAINIIAKISGDIPLVGFVITIVILIGGHIFNMLLAVLSAFVHTLRLQYVEFFPKFLVGGGREFKPLTKQYEYIYLDNKNE